MQNAWLYARVLIALYTGKHSLIQTVQVRQHGQRTMAILTAYVTFVSTACLVSWHYHHRGMYCFLEFRNKYMPALRTAGFRQIAGPQHGSKEHNV